MQPFAIVKHLDELEDRRARSTGPRPWYIEGKMKYVTAIAGATLVFTGVGLATLFVAKNLAEERSATAQVIAIGSCVLAGLRAATASFRATLRR